MSVHNIKQILLNGKVVSKIVDKKTGNVVYESLTDEEKSFVANMSHPVHYLLSTDGVNSSNVWLDKVRDYGVTPWDYQFSGTPTIDNVGIVFTGSNYATHSIKTTFEKYWWVEVKCLWTTQNDTTYGHFLLDFGSLQGSPSNTNSFCFEYSNNGTFAASDKIYDNNSTAINGQRGEYFNVTPNVLHTIIFGIRNIEGTEQTFYVLDGVLYPGKKLITSAMYYPNGTPCYLGRGVVGGGEGAGKIQSIKLHFSNFNIDLYNKYKK